MKLKDFLEKYGDSLKEKVVQGLRPLFNPVRQDKWDTTALAKLSELKREPFVAQQKAIVALAKGFFLKNKKGQILTAEMGTGKTICSIAVAHLIPKSNYRVMIMCPGHLVQKWIREIEITLPRCKTINLNGPGLTDIQRLRYASKPKCPEFYVIGKERAKNHHQWKHGFLHYKHLVQFVCPDCGHILDETGITKRPKCPTCKTPLYQADKDGFRRYAKAEYAKKYLKGKIDLCIVDEVHELKGGTTAQGQAFANFAGVAKKTLALTGTLLGGYSTNLFYIFWRLMPREMIKNKVPFNSPMQFAENYGVIERTRTKKKLDESNDASIGRSQGRLIVKEKPGLSPLVLSDFLLGQSVFMRLADISNTLPSFDEEVIEVEMTPDLKEAYRTFEVELYDALKKALARGDNSLLGAFINSLLGYPDGARRGEIVIHPHKDEVVASAPPIEAAILPKESELLEILKKEISNGRKCMVCLEHTGTRDLIPDLMERLEGIGLKPFALRSKTVKVDKREAWVKEKTQSGSFDVMITNPNLIKTGLDLLEFPTIIFFQTGYSIYTLRQASRRSWRIGQKQPVKVFYMAYAKTMQATALSLIATKLETALAIEGDLSDKGLTVLAEGTNSMLIEMARSLVSKQEIKPVGDVWQNYKKKEFAIDSFIGIDQIETETTTTILTRGDKSATITHKRVIRGKVYPKNGYAVGYVDKKHKFIFKNNQVLFNGQAVGDYNKKGIGQINNKAIQLVAAKSNNCYLLVELSESDQERSAVCG